RLREKGFSMIWLVIAAALAPGCPRSSTTAILWPTPGASGVSRRGRMPDQKTPLADRLRRATDGLVYQSETDAPVEPFLMTGWTGPEVTSDAIVAFTKHDTGTKVVEVPFDDFFADLVALQDWYGDEERATA